MSKLDFPTFVLLQGKQGGFIVPKLHIEIAEWLEETDHEPRRVLQVFRNAGKSHLISLWVVYKLLQDPNYKILMISALSDLAIRNTRFMREIIDTNPFCKHLRGEDKWAESKFFVRRNIAGLEPSVQVTSITSKYTGKHSDLLISDDVETQDNVISAEGRDYLRFRMMEFGSIADQHIFIGTPHHKETIYSDLEERGYPCLKIPLYDHKKTLAWPERFDWKFVEQRKKEVTEGYFASQYLLIPSSIEDTFINTDHLRYYDEPISPQELLIGDRTIWETYYEGKTGKRRIKSYGVYWDWASGESGRDDSVVAVVYKDIDDRVYVHRVVHLPPVHPERGWDDQCDTIISVLIELGLSTITVEAGVAMTLPAELRKAAKRRGQSINVKKYARTSFSLGEYEKIKSTKARFIAWNIEPVANAGRLHVSEHARKNSKFLEQLREFPNNKKDDAIDAVAGAIAQLSGDVVDTKGTKAMENRVMSQPRKHWNKYKPLTNNRRTARL